MVRERGVEPLNPFGHMGLNHACFPISSYAHGCSRRESNPISLGYEPNVIPFHFAAILVRVTRFELATNAPKAFMLPLHYTHIAGNPIYYSLGFAFKARFVFSYATISGTPVGLCTHPTYYPVTCMNFAPMRESNSPASAVPLR